MNSKSQALKDLQMIPGVGPSIANDLILLGIQTINDLQNQNAEELFQKHCSQKKTEVDRCVLYVFREAIYYAESDYPDPELLKWWNWKD